ncbi:MAG TPA: SDR family NAD(P)-dependent oxidoreductase [Solirubrobacterales bacterium]|nr:SDR family NAD(P)-dependent oxidoreductase [Solirubrobacterales bacterium]
MPRIALITGATRGLGFETARLLGRRGDRVILAARNAAAGELAADALLAEGVQAESVTLDVTSAVSVRAANVVKQRHGHLDLLVNNAGILPEATEIHEDVLDLEMFRRTFETNLFGPVAMIEYFLPLLLRSEKGGVIVNVSSRMGSLSDQLNPDSPYHGVVVPAYQASKAALNALTVSLSKKLAETPVVVNSVCPGWLQTDLGGPRNRAAAPMSAAEGARIVVDRGCYPEAPGSGRFLDETGVVAW